MQAEASTRLAFLIAGLATACWAALVPFARARLGIGDGSLGLLLLCLGVGSILAMPASGLLTGRFGCRLVIVTTGCILCLALPLLAIAPGVSAMAGLLLLFGAALGALDVSMNIHALLVERDAGRSLMSGFHGLYSAGGIVGAFGMSLLLSHRAGPLGASCTIAALALCLLWVATPALRPTGGGAPGRVFALPRGPLLLIGLLCTVCFLAEGAMVDWSALLLIQRRALSQSWSGAGFAVFSAAMTFGRLAGDALVRRAGRRAMLSVGSLLGAMGLAAAAAGTSWPVSLTGLALAGAGLANLSPLLIGVAGRIAPASGSAVAAVCTLGYGGILAGPGLIGLAASRIGLPSALGLVAVLMLGVAIVTGRIASLRQDGGRVSA